MSLGSLNRVVSQLISHGMPRSTPAAVVENGTKTNQRVLEAELGQIAQVCDEHEAKSPAILFVERWSPCEFTSRRKLYGMI